ncbi:lytic transglycosylase [Ruegeria pomeroyi]|uniref:Lytic transglycosylase n=2 Tax=Ruegeria TaxID=97050 RepID=A0A9Q3WLY4_9RHOB|nr:MULTISPECIES: lytic transglycosylase [Ruegeria]MCE8512576.1 lytic transglycosylase [Ruegeria pomeroyi]MCE8521704.1 lytic transglycosylase [Ruegeria pomeroyi]MCE8525357.1 lytic transglycosylase [Ruegeria pomeroyi]MCE8529389.1 lytic transglycosylase [Ruegeria pomeroyi]MCE8533731.1 lytic transglycosylase [Ruegeria pomeroyi]
MSRSLCALVAVLLMVSCSGGSKNPPRNLDDACSIAGERPEYIKAFKQTERKWGVPVHVQMSTIYYESRYRSDARTPHQFVLGVIPVGRQSSAFGYSQALDGTWDQYRKETGRRGAKRDRIKDASDFIGWYMNKTREKNGISLGDARNQYLAYHEGHAGYARGSHNGKSWLLRTADDVAARANMYQRQLSSCRRYRN